MATVQAAIQALQLMKKRPHASVNPVMSMSPLALLFAFFRPSFRTPIASTYWRLGVVTGGLRVNRPAAENFFVKAQNRHECRALAIDLFVQDSIDSGLGDIKSLRNSDFAEPGSGLDFYEHFVACLHEKHSIPHCIELSSKE
jgi:hypothetical protein